MLRRKDSRRAQTFMEYTIVLGIVVAVVAVMTTFIKRGAQSMIKGVADVIGDQVNSDQPFTASGHMEKQYSFVRSDKRKTTRDDIGMINYIFDDITHTDSQVISNLGRSKTD